MGRLVLRNSAGVTFSTPLSPTYPVACKLCKRTPFEGESGRVVALFIHPIWRRVQSRLELQHYSPSAPPMACYRATCLQIIVLWPLTPHKVTSLLRRFGEYFSSICSVAELDGCCDCGEKMFKDYLDCYFSRFGHAKMKYCLDICTVHCV
jgi:hypothetical protein